MKLQYPHLPRIVFIYPIKFPRAIHYTPYSIGGYVFVYKLLLPAAAGLTVTLDLRFRVQGSNLFKYMA